MCSSKTNYVLTSALLSAVLSLSVLQSAVAEEDMVSASTSSTNKMNVGEPTFQRALPLSYYSEVPRTDEELTNLIKEQLSLESGVEMNKLTVQTVNGVVMLTGTASSKASIDRINQIARSAGSVKFVESTVSLE